MSALSIIEAATAEGLVVDLSQSGSLKVVGDQETVVITSYSIHYTKLYESVAAASR